MRRSVFLIIMVAVPACDDGRAVALDEGVTVRDSAGVELVTNAGSERVLPTREVLRVGLIDGDRHYLFSAIRGLALDGDGGFWVVDRHEAVRHYDAAGNYTGSIGGSGSGPGEARGYGDVWMADGTVLVWGYPSMVQQFAPDGTLLDSRAAMADGGMLMPVGHAAGRLYFTLQRLSAGSDEVFRRPLHVVAGRDLGAAYDTVATFPGNLHRSAGGGEVARASWFFGNPSFGVDGAGRLFLSDTLRYRISVFDADGQLVRVIERSATPRPIDPAWRADIEEGVTAALRRDRDVPVDLAMRDRLVAGILPAGLPAHLAFVQRLLVSRDGGMWVERADRHPRPGMRAVAHSWGYVRHAWRPEWKAPQVFDLFAPTGAYRGTVEFPADFEVMAVSADRAYGVHYDELGVEYVVVYDVVTS